MDEHEPESRPVDGASHTTAQLLVRVREGDLGARNELFERHRPELARWARGRLPRHARDVRDTDDLVQDAMVSALARLQSFEPRHEGSFLAYLCHILVNLVRDELRAARRRPGRVGLPEELEARGGSPEEDLAAREMLARYREALRRLTTDQRDALVLRLELGLPYEAIADEMGGRSVNAVRLLVSRALDRLAHGMSKPVG